MKGKERGGGVFVVEREKKSRKRRDLPRVLFPSSFLPFQRRIFQHSQEKPCTRAEEREREREREEEYTHTHTHTHISYLQLCHLLRHFYSLPSCTTIIQRRFLGEETAAGEVILHQSFRRRGRRYEKPAAGGKARVLLSPV